VRAVLALTFVLLAAQTARSDEAFRTAPDRPFSVEHIALDLDVDLAGKAISGSASLDVRAVRDLGSIRLDAMGLEVASVSVARPNAQPAPAHFANGGEHLDVTSTWT
jgi:aminopeptidase N